MIGIKQDMDAEGLREIGEQSHALSSRGPLGAQDVRELSIRLRITERRVETLLEQVALVDGIGDFGAAQLIAIIQELATKTLQDKKDLEEAKLPLFVTNRVLRSYIEDFLLRAGGIPETSSHRGYLVIRIGNLLLAAIGRGHDVEQFLSVVVKACQSQNRLLTVTEYTTVLHERTPSEVAGKLQR
jgi:hypothetical protein